MKKGFTLLELIIVVVIIGILATIAVPQFFKVAERGRAAEGLAALGAVRSSQLRYAAEHGATAGSAEDLDMSLLGLKFFDATALTGGILPDDITGVAIVTFTRKADVSNPGYGAYALSIAVDGDISCADGPKAICRTLGY